MEGEHVRARRGHRHLAEITGAIAVLAEATDAAAARKLAARAEAAEPLFPGLGRHDPLSLDKFRATKPAP